MDIKQLTQDEADRLAKIEDGGAFGWRFQIAVKEHFDSVGKFQAFAAEPTEAEKKEQMKWLGVSIKKAFSDATQLEAAHATLKGTDMFVTVARRIGSDAELAALIPANKKFDTADVAMLEKCELRSLAALAKLRP